MSLDLIPNPIVAAAIGMMGLLLCLFLEQRVFPRWPWFDFITHLGIGLVVVVLAFLHNERLLMFLGCVICALGIVALMTIRSSTRRERDRPGEAISELDPRHFGERPRGPTR